MPVREAARALHIAKDTATKTFHELEEKGFIKRHVCGSFDWKIRHATTWILTEFALGEDPPTKEFARWRPPSLETSPKSETRCPNPGTANARFLLRSLRNVLYLGPSALFGAPARSQITARI